MESASAPGVYDNLSGELSMSRFEAAKLATGWLLAILAGIAAVWGVMEAVCWAADHATVKQIGYSIIVVCAAAIWLLVYTAARYETGTTRRGDDT